MKVKAERTNKCPSCNWEFKLYRFEDNKPDEAICPYCFMDMIREWV